MLKAIMSTGAALGTAFLAGYVAKRYFGWHPEELLEKAEHKLGTSGRSDSGRSRTGGTSV